jgi:predicted small metal-binding protein
VWFSPEEMQVTKSFACRDAGVVCNAKVTGDTEDEVLAKAVEHAREKHGVDLTVSKTLARYAQAQIRDEGSAAPTATASGSTES